MVLPQETLQPPQGPDAKEANFIGSGKKRSSQGPSVTLPSSKLPKLLNAKKPINGTTMNITSPNQKVVLKNTSDGVQQKTVPTRMPAANTKLPPTDVIACERLISAGKLSNGATLEFVSIDLEFTGLTFDETDRGGPSSSRPNFSQYFQSLVKGARNFAIVQFGVCLAGRKTGDDHWYMEPFNIYLFPKRRRLCFVDTTSLSFLSNCGFQFNRWVAEGVDFEAIHDITYERLNPDDKNNMIADLDDVETNGAQIIIQSIMEHSVPMVVHNGLLDLLHLCDKFVASVGNVDESKFAERILQCFPGGIFDTKYISRNMQIGSNFMSQFSSGFSLEKLSDILLNCDGSGMYRPMKVIGALKQRYSAREGARFHEAGYDALLTAECFIYELCHCILTPNPMATLANMFSQHFYSPTASMDGLAAGMAGAMNAMVGVHDHCHRCISSEICENWSEFCVRSNLINILDLYVAPNCFDMQAIMDDHYGEDSQHYDDDAGSQLAHVTGSPGATNGSQKTVQTNNNIE